MNQWNWKWVIALCARITKYYIFRLFDHSTGLAWLGFSTKYLNVFGVNWNCVKMNSNTEKAKKMTLWNVSTLLHIFPRCPECGVHLFIFCCCSLLLFIWCRASKNVQTVFPHYFDFILAFPLFNRYSSFGTFVLLTTMNNGRVRAIVEPAQTHK